MSDLLVWNELGTIYFKIGCHEEAIAAFEKAIELAPECGWPYSNLGLTYAHQGKYTEAIPLYRKSTELLKSNKEKAISWNRLGDAYRHLNDGNKAMMAYQKAVELDVGDLEEAAGAQAPVVTPDTPEGLAANPIDDLEAAVTSDRPSKSEPVSEDMADWLRRLEDQEDPSVAGAGPVDQDLQAWLEASSAGSDEENTPVAETPSDREVGSHYWVLDTNVPIEPQPPYFPRGKGTPGEPLDRTLPPAQPRGKGIPPSTEAANLEPSDRFKLLVKGMLPPPNGKEGNQPDLTGALSVLEEPESVEEALRQEVRSSLGRLDEDATPPAAGPATLPKTKADTGPLHRTELEQAIAAYQNVTENSPMNDRAWDALGNSLRAVGRYDEALAAFERAISLAPDKDEYHYHVGLVYAAQNRYDEAIQAFQMVLKLNPEDALAHAALAGTYRRLGLEAEAAKHIQIAQPLMDGEREYNRACFEAICGNKDQAIKLLEFALETKQTPLEWALADPDLEPIHEDPRFKALIH